MQNNNIVKFINTHFNFNKIDETKIMNGLKNNKL